MKRPSKRKSGDHIAEAFKDGKAIDAAIKRAVRRALKLTKRKPAKPKESPRSADQTRSAAFTHNDRPQLVTSPFSPDPRSHHQRMLDGDHYIASDPRILQDLTRAATLCHQFNHAPPADSAALSHILRDLLGSIGDDTVIRPPFHCDYGSNIHIGARAFANFGLIALDVAPITIGDDVLIGPSVQLLTPTHPLEPGPRKDKWESAKPITIGHNVWLGGGVIVCPGVTIGDNAVIGAGSIVTKDIPANVLAVGNPARVLRPLPSE